MIGSLSVRFYIWSQSTLCKVESNVNPNQHVVTMVMVLVDPSKRVFIYSCKSTSVSFERLPNETLDSSLGNYILTSLNQNVNVPV